VNPAVVIDPRCVKTQKSEKRLEESFSIRRNGICLRRSAHFPSRSFSQAESLYSVQLSCPNFTLSYGEKFDAFLVTNLLK
jgi:hypothetical protein